MNSDFREFRLLCDYTLSLKEDQIGSVLDEVINAIVDITEKRDGLIAGKTSLSKF